MQCPDCCSRGASERFGGWQLFWNPLPTSSTAAPAPSQDSSRHAKYSPSYLTTMLLRRLGTTASVETMTKSPDAEGRTVSHEAIYRWIYALPKGELAKSGILLQSKRTKRKSVKPLGERTGGRIIGMASIDDRPEAASDRRVPGSWEGDLMVGKGGKSDIATLVERHSRFLIMLGLPEGKKADGLADVLIDRVNDLPALMRGSLTWDQGTEMARHAQLTLATDLPVYFAHPHSPW
ncbi:IS30 family transposase [Arthrobacter sp. LAPM80]|uniref:IS30 family transposase n=1 Tax=Arthrobacter sp. LAPM80 TaxID=3141788 RepID=UPI00398B48AB